MNDAPRIGVGQIKTNEEFEAIFGKEALEKIDKLEHQKFPFDILIRHWPPEGSEPLTFTVKVSPIPEDAPL